MSPDVDASLVEIVHTHKWFYSARSSLSAPIEWIHDLAVFVFSAGFALEVLADYQLNRHKKHAGNATVNREGVWSIVRHPK